MTKLLRAFQILSLLSPVIWLYFCGFLGSLGLFAERGWGLPNFIASVMLFMAFVWVAIEVVATIRIEHTFHKKELAAKRIKLLEIVAPGTNESDQYLDLTILKQRAWDKRRGSMSHAAFRRLWENA
jgi:hypothetical protein